MNTKDSIETIEKQNKATANKATPQGLAAVPVESTATKKPTDPVIKPSPALHHDKVTSPAVIKASKQKIRMYDKYPGLAYFYCPGCREYHSLNTTRPNNNGTTFVITGTLDKPTVTPMINRTIEKFNSSKHAKNPSHVCNSIIREGTIRFLENCTHDLAGRVVDLPFVD
jgi:hypothetical protein